jgi:hypothetical protein
MVKDHVPPLIMFLAIGASCIWGLIKIWRGEEKPSFIWKGTQRPSVIWKGTQRPSVEESPTDLKPFDSGAFEAWLKASGLASTDLPPERLFELRQAFLKQE